jgi:ornithine carbamoyltransferase|tara:strand:+ start:103 stop:1017 length:915 start_codon:yes stop_codon:yes gene_type:complete
LNKKLVSIEELDAREIKKLVNLAKKFKTNNKISTKTIRNKTLALIFQKPSTRTRLSFEVAMRELGGNSIFLSYADLQLSRGELIKDTAKTLSQYVDIVVIRTFNNSDILEFAENSSIPVINALSNTNHPCQALSDIQTIIENKKNIQNLNISWIGDSNNVFNDFMIASLKLGANFSVSCPKRYFPNKRILKLAKEIADNNGSKLLITTDPIKAAKDADVISTDKIISMGDKNIKEKRKQFLPKYKITQSLMSKAKDNAIFMHCLPAVRGEEVSEKVIDGNNSVIWQQVENKLHMHKALIWSLLK